jgi:hypothetical protein
LTWPMAQLRTAEKIEGSATRAAQAMVTKFYANCLPAPNIATEVASGQPLQHKHRSPIVKSITKSRNLWVPIPYHPLVTAAISHSLKSISDEPDTKARWFAVFGSAMPTLRAAWKNSAPHLEQQVRMLVKKRKTLDLRKEEGASMVEALVAVVSADPVLLHDHDLTDQHDKQQEQANDDTFHRHSVLTSVPAKHTKCGGRISRFKIPPDR